MADDGFSYVTEIQDRMSGPAHQEIRALKELQAELRHSSAAVRELQAQQLKYREQGLKGLANQVGSEIKRVRVHMGGLKTSIDEASEKMEGGLFSETLQNIGKITGPMLVASAIEKIGEAAVEAGHKLLELGVSAIETAEMKENAIVAYGGGEEGEATFKAIDQVAQDAHVRAEKAHAMASELVLQGLDDTKLVAAAVKAQADLVRVGQEGGAAKLGSIIERSLAAGHFELGKGGIGKGKLAGLGITGEEFASQLASDMHKPVAVIKEQLKAGQITTDQGIAAITKTIDEGRIGEAARKTLKLEDIGTEFHNFWERTTEDVDTSGVQQAFAGVGAALQELEGVGAGKDTIQLVVDAIAEGIDTLTIWGLGFDTFRTDVETDLQPVIRFIREVNEEMAKVGNLGQGVSLPAPENTAGPSLKSLSDVQTIGYLPPNAAGGEVMRPPPGEAFAPVAPGEHIVPAGMDVDLGGGRMTHVDVGGIHIAVHGTKDAHELVAELRPMLESEIADVFDRANLEAGR